MYKCNQCDKEFLSERQLAGHIGSLIRKGTHVKTYKKNNKIKEEWKINDKKYKCPYCNLDFPKAGISSHIWRKHEAGINHDTKSSVGKKGSPSWNKGLTKETDDRIKKIGETYKQGILNGTIIPSFLGKKHSIETRKKLSLTSGGYRKGSGLGKHGWYKGYWCDSSYELAWVIYNLEHGIKFERNRNGFEYEWEGKIRKYYPDFLLDDGTFIEIKGYEREQTFHKYNAIKNKLVILKKTDLKNILEYVIRKYGKDFIKLYEDSPYLINPKNKSREIYLEELKAKTIELQKVKIELVLKSKIDFSKNGWVGKIAEEINHPRTHIKYWFKKYMPEFYEEKCKKR